MIPNRLQRGDLVGVIALASPPCMENLEKGLQFLTTLGLQVRLGKHMKQVNGYLAGTDSERVTDFHDMVVDPDIRAIFLARGGYGTGRLANKIDYDLIRKNPKIIWGYSDMTYLHTTIRQRSNLVTFHGPMIESDLAKSNIDQQTKQMFQQLFAPMSIYYSESISSLQVIVSGEASGELIGGNLTVLTSTFGTSFEIDVKDKIVFMEDIDEEPYRIDAMLNQWKLANKFSEAAGILVGNFALPTPMKKPSLKLSEVLDNYLGDLTCPVMSGLSIGHCFPHISIPLGVQANIKTKQKIVTIAPGVK